MEVSPVPIPAGGFGYLVNEKGSPLRLPFLLVFELGRSGR